LFKLKDGFINRWLLLLVGLLVLEIFFGVVMVDFAIPAFLQPLHLVTATLIFGVQFFLLIIYHYAARYKPVAKIYA
jgi:cytochrome c oxidase assembly protein subunit 15